MRALMLQGTGSNVGKSVLMAGMVRAFYRRGMAVFPFKPQNMSNNAAVTVDGGEIGRAQALQAQAGGLAPHTDMNPVLLKPESEQGAQIIVQGKRIGRLKAADYGKMKASLLPRVMESYHRLARRADLVLIEGAGSPAEVNLRRGDIANMGFAAAADLPVVLIGDIDRGGIIAQIIGTKAVLDGQDSARIKGFIVNKFRGTRALFDEGYDIIKAKTAWAGLGICPWFADADKLPAEDALDIGATRQHGTKKIGFLQFPRIANFDDLDPLKNEPDVALCIIKPGQPIAGDLALVILPGSKSTIGDLAFLRAQGWDIDLKAHLRRGGRILGLCGGYQMLGTSIADPQNIESTQKLAQGLGFLNIETTLTPEKRLQSTNAVHLGTNSPISGYEIHIGQSHGPDCARPFAKIGTSAEGAISADGRVEGTYLHGIFASDTFRRAYLAKIGIDSHLHSYSDMVENTLDRLANHIEAHCDLDLLLKIAT